MAEKSRLATLLDVKEILEEFNCRIPIGYLEELSDTIKENKKHSMPTILTLRAVVVSCYEFWGNFFYTLDEKEEFVLDCVKTLCNGIGVCVVTCKKKPLSGISIHDYTSGCNDDLYGYQTRACWDWEHVVYKTPTEDGFVEPYTGIVRRTYTGC